MSQKSPPGKEAVKRTALQAMIDAESTDHDVLTKAIVDTLREKLFTPTTVVYVRMMEEGGVHVAHINFPAVTTVEVEFSPQA